MDKKKCPKMKTQNTFWKKVVKNEVVTRMLSFPK